MVSVDVGNPAFNVIPGEVRLKFNVRFNDQWTHDSLAAEVKRRVAAVDGGGRATLTFEPSNAKSAFYFPHQTGAFQPDTRIHRSGPGRDRAGKPSLSTGEKAGLRTHASSRTPARWSSSASSTRRFTPSTSESRSTISKRCRASMSARSTFISLRRRNSRRERSCNLRTPLGRDFRRSRREGL